VIQQPLVAIPGKRINLVVTACCQRANIIGIRVVALCLEVASIWVVAGICRGINATPHHFIRVVGIAVVAAVTSEWTI